MDLSLIILNYKTRGMLKQCLRGLLLNHYAIAHEIIVVDNHSNDGTDAMMREDFPALTFIASPTNGGYAAGMNLGIQRARGKYLLLLNTDIAILGNAIEQLVAYMDSHAQVGIAGPKLLNPDGSVQESCRGFPSVLTIALRRTPFGKLPAARRKLDQFLMLDWDHASNRPVDWLLGACMIVRRSAMERVGLLDERFFLYFEDVDWCRRFWEAGYQVHYLGEATEIVHYHRRLSADRGGLQAIFGYATRVHIASGIKYFTKYAGAHLPVRHAVDAESRP